MRASRFSIWFGPTVIIGLGVSGVVLWVLIFRGSIDRPRRYRGQISQLIALATACFVIGLGFVALVRAVTSRGSLIAVDGRRIRIQTLRGVADLKLDRVEFITAAKKHRVQTLAVGDADGRMYRPILQPDGEDWESVAEQLNELLDEHRRRSRASPSGCVGST